MLNIAIIGIGSIGSLCTAWLTQVEGINLTLISRSVYPAMTFETSNHSFHLKTHILTPEQVQEQDIQTMDWVLIATKHHQTKQLGPVLSKICDEKTKLVILQNSVEHTQLVEPFVKTKRFLPVIIRCSIMKPSPTFFMQTTPATFTTPNTLLGNEFAQLFTHSDITIQKTHDFLTSAWEKLCINANHSIHVLLNQPAGIIHESDIEYLFKTIMQEVVTVARFEGAKLSYGDINRLVDKLKKEPEDSSNPMLEDYQLGNDLEVDAQNGAVVRLARHHGINVPYNHMLYTLLNHLSLQNTQGAL